MSQLRHIIITGAAGFIGSRLVQRLLCSKTFEDCSFTLVDSAELGTADQNRVRHIQGDFCAVEVLEHAFDRRVDAIVHLAGVLGGAAEANYELARRVNIDATLRLLERARDIEKPPRIVFASSIAVFGPDLPQQVNDDTLPLPVMTYGAQKRMMEIALEQFSARGWIDGIALRLPGIVANRRADARLKSAFLNTLFYEFSGDTQIVIPVDGSGTSWLISVGACVDAFEHALMIPKEALGRRRAITLPALRVELNSLVAALRRRFPDARSSIIFRPDPALSKQFANYPPLVTETADRLGFRSDGRVERLIERSYE